MPNSCDVLAGMLERMITGVVSTTRVWDFVVDFHLSTQELILYSFAGCSGCRDSVRLFLCVGDDRFGIVWACFPLLSGLCIQYMVSTGRYDNNRAKSCKRAFVN